MKILFYINCLTRGGAERVFTNLANSFSLSNQCVMVTSYPAENEYQCCERIKRVFLEEKRRTNFLVRNLLLIKRLRKAIKNEKPDLVISFMAEPNFRILFATLFNKKVKKIISIRNDPHFEYSSFVSRLMAKCLFPTADSIVFQTEDAVNCFSKKIKKKAVILPNAVNESFFREKYYGERRDIVSVGRLSNQKNFELLISSFNRIKDQITDNLIIYGEGPNRTALEKMINQFGISDRVKLPGLVSNVPELIQASSVFVLPSNYEGLPNALMEAMALGVPCVSTDCPCGGPRMLISNKINGLLVPIKDEYALSCAILDAINGKYPSLGDEAYSSMLNYKPDIVFGKWEELIKNTMEKRCC